MDGGKDSGLCRIRHTPDHVGLWIMSDQFSVERMFNSDEVTSVVDLAKLECLKRKIVGLFFPNKS
jgi:hypothetical protein